MADIRTHIEVRGARQNNLKNIDVDIPRDQLTVITGVSGSGKSSLAFNVIYGEAQRRFLQSVSNFAKSRIGQIKKPKVDAIRGLSPVIAIEQKKGNINPRSTVGTVTDVNDYLRLLFATAGVCRCPVCGQPLAPMTPARIAERLAALPQGSEVGMYTRAPLVYGEDYEFLFARIRERGYRHILLDGKPYDLAEKPYIPGEGETCKVEILLDRFTIRDEIYIQLAKSMEMAVETLEDDVLLRFALPDGCDIELGCPEHRYVLPQLQPYHFSFNAPASACNTCLGVGNSHVVEPRFLAPNQKKSIRQGALNPTLFNANAKNSFRSVILYSLSVRYGFSLDTPFEDYPDSVKDLLYYGSRGELVEMLQPPFLEKRNWIVGRVIPFRGFVRELESQYRNYIRRAGNADAYEPSFVKCAMIEKICPECRGARLKPSRLNVTVGGRNIDELSALSFPELTRFLQALRLPGDDEVTSAIVREITSRLQLLTDIGLHYLCLGRRSDSISGGEMQRIKMSTQISSELMGMLYVIDEPSIGLHPRDADKVIRIMKRLRDIGNTVIVVEHDLTTMRNADYLIEVGPGAGSRGGSIVASGDVSAFLADENSLSAAYLNGRRGIPVPAGRRQPKAYLAIRGASAHNLKHIDVDIPLGVFLCVTGVSGSGKSTLIFETLAKYLEVEKRGVRVVPGDCDSLTGGEALSNVVIIDQSPIGRTSRSNPATYVGVYDRIRTLFAAQPAAEAHGYTPGDFSLAQPNGARCEHCLGMGVIVTNLQFMADIESVCPVCKGDRFSGDGLGILYHGKNIAQVLNMTVEEALDFFADQPLIRHKLSIMHELGLGYLTLGQSATTLSGGEAQRVKLSYELGKIKRGSHNLYIMDEPTTGLHCADIDKLLTSINGLVARGHSVICVEHNMDVIKSADYIIDMGPDGGGAGGTIVATGTPEAVAACEASYTGRYLKEALP